MLSRPAGLVGLADETVGRRVEISRRAQDVAHALLGDHRREPIAAQQEDIAGPDRIGPGVDLDLGLGTQRAGDDRTLRMLGGLLLGQLALPDQLVDQRVVLRQPSQLTVPEQIGAAVADVGDGQMGVVEVCRGQRGAHSGTALLGSGAVVDAVVGVADELGQASLRRS